ncbi:hypothetical protein NDU88_003563 [Pleurodeles waltl]|uniref:Endonuclease/exonuclease/phosphatase domain-containing protein n=1 Tax=Pleurodeles waltl TaxID=8319 RepID=A0AAV7VDS8_PLEWA|nr:hypothetical protein NDU88_003563 [Pleurodeles waltl]
MGLSRGATRHGSGRASGGLITLASTRIADKFIEIKTKCRWLLAGQVDLYNVIGGAKQLLILNVYIQPENVFDYNVQRGLFEEDLELLCTGNADRLILMLGDFNHKLDPNDSDNLFKELLAAAQIPRSIFPKVECSARDLSLARTLGSFGMFCLNGRIESDCPAKKTFRTEKKAIRFCDSQPDSQRCVRVRSLRGRCLRVCKKRTRNYRVGVANCDYLQNCLQMQPNTPESIPEHSGNTSWHMMMTSQPGS